MPESIDIHIKNIQAKLQVLLKSTRFWKKKMRGLRRKIMCIKQMSKILLTR